MTEILVLLPTKKKKKTKRINNIVKKFFASNNVSQETRGSLKPVDAKPGVIYRIYKVCKYIINNCPSFRPTLPAISAPV